MLTLFAFTLSITIVSAESISTSIYSSKESLEKNILSSDLGIELSEEIFLLKDTQLSDVIDNYAGIYIDSYDELIIGIATETESSFQEIKSKYVFKNLRRRKRDQKNNCIHILYCIRDFFRISCLNYN